MAGPLDFWPAVKSAPRSLPSRRMADTRLSFIHGVDLLVDAAAVTTVGSTPTVTLATAVAATAVLKANAAPLFTPRCDLILGATGTTYSFIAPYSGTLVTAAAVTDGATTATGASSLAITIGGVAVVLSGALSFASTSASGTTVSRTVSSAGAFTAGQVIRVTTTNANTAATFATLVLGATRA
jgi:hypothetical protein